MRKIYLSNIPDGLLSLMTTGSICDMSPMQSADFQDSFALKLTVANAFIGIDRNANLKLGLNPRMINGEWFIQESPDLNEAFKEIRSNVENVILVRIE